MTYTLPVGYYDNTDITKNYSRLLFIAGRGLSAAELNGLQDLIKNDLAALGRFLVQNGSVISGGSVTQLLANSISLAAAVVFIDGHAVQVPAATVGITGVGLEYIGVATVSHLITDNDDPSIRELDPLSPNYGNALSYREQILGRWCKSTSITSDETFFPIITLNNGKIISNSPSTGPNFNDLLNQYDREIRGNAVLYGMGVSYAYTDNVGNIILSVSSGKARVLGVPVIVPFVQNTALPPITDTRTALGEPVVYTGNGTYSFRFTPGQGIMSAQGTKQRSDTVTHGTFNTAQDALPNTPVLQIISVVQGGTTFVKGTDYQLTGNNVDWSINPGTSNKPSPGSTYTVVYQYISTFTPTMTNNGSGFTLDSSNTLVTGSTFYVNYIYYLSRCDRLSVNSSGQYVVSRGTPGYGTVYPNPISSTSLSLANILLTYGQIPVVTIDTYNTLSVANLDQMQADINYNKLNIAVLSLTQNANSQAPTSTKRNIFVDSLSSNAQQDLGQTNTSFIQPDTTNTVNPTGNCLTLTSNLQVLGTTASWVTLPYTELQFQAQTSITTTRLINPYASQATTSLQPRILCNPPIKYGNELWFYYHGNFLPYNTIIQVQCTGYQPGETVGITVGSPGIYTNTLPTNDGNTANYILGAVATATSAASDSNGNVNVNVTIVAGTVNGVYQVTGTGNTSGVIATTTFSIFVNPDRLNGDYFQPITNPLPYGYDPLAQTFETTTAYDITSCTLYVGNVPGDDLRVRIVNAQFGFPDTSTLFSDGLKKRSTITANSWNTIWFPNPSTAVANQEYALTVLCNDTTGTLGTAVMGQYTVDTHKLITAQPAPGVLQTSSNYSTWTPIQTEDLAYTLNRAVYTINTPTTTTLLTATGCVNYTDWFVSGYVRIPSTTTCRLYLQDTNGNQYDIIPNVPLFTPPLSGTVVLKCTMSSSDNTKSPKIQTGFELIGGTPTLPATYTSRQFPIPNGTVTPANFTIVMDIYAPTAASIVPQIQNADNSWGSATLSGSGTQIGNGWVTATYTYGPVSSLGTRFRLLLNTTDNTQRPKVENIRVLVI